MEVVTLEGVIEVIRSRCVNDLSLRSTRRDRSGFLGRERCRQTTTSDAARFFPRFGRLTVWGEDPNDPARGAAHGYMPETALSILIASARAAAF
jgi:hypothetical protein